MARRRAVTVALVCGLLAPTAGGCGGSDGNSAAQATSTTGVTTSAFAAGYVARVNKLCAELLPGVLAIYGGGGHPAPYPIKVFQAEQPRLTALYAAFDEQVDALPVSAAERRAAQAFMAYRRLSDDATATLTSAAATGRQDRFDAAFYEVHKMFDSNAALNEMHAVGIGCNAR